MDLLRQIVASPRARHPEAGLDLCYVTDTIIATSGPGATYPQVAYRNPLKDLVKFLDAKHGAEWMIWEFRAEGTGYPDEEVYGRVRHYPWPDHHPPPFALVPLIMASMRNWMKGEDAQGKGRVVIVHCKAGKGRSGTIACSYMISEEGWTEEEARQRFSERRMRPGFGAGVSIPSQLRYLGYVDRWTKGGKLYVDRPVEVLEVHIWGLREGVKISIEGYEDEGKIIKSFHTFQSSERETIRGTIRKGSGLADAALEVMGKKPMKLEKRVQTAPVPNTKENKTNDNHGDVVFRPSEKVVVPSSDVNIDFERRNKSTYGGFTVVTSIAHVWFNAFFEGNGPEQAGKPDDSGVFNIEFDALDGIKGSSRKGTRAFDRMCVVWKALDVELKADNMSNELSLGEDVPQTRPADWRGGDDQSKESEKKLGLRVTSTDSEAVSRASSTLTLANGSEDTVGDELEGTRSHGPNGEDLGSTAAQEDSSDSGLFLSHPQSTFKDAKETDGK